MVAAFGFPTFFALTAAMGIPVVVLCLFFGRAGAAKETAAPEPEAAPTPVGAAKPA